MLKMSLSMKIHDEYKCFYAVRNIFKSKKFLCEKGAIKLYDIYYTLK